MQVLTTTVEANLVLGSATRLPDSRQSRARLVLANPSMIARCRTARGRRISTFYELAFWSDGVISRSPSCSAKSRKSLGSTWQVVGQGAVSFCGRGRPRRTAGCQHGTMSTSWTADDQDGAKSS